MVRDSEFMVHGSGCSYCCAYVFSLKDVWRMVAVVGVSVYCLRVWDLRCMVSG